MQEFEKESFDRKSENAIIDQLKREEYTTKSYQ